jgi:hypothetical protein
MQLRRHAGWLALGLLAALAVPLRADPLRLTPEKADFVLKVEKPRQLLDTALGLDFVQQFQNLAPVRERLDATDTRRFFQLLTYFEKRLGASRADLLDKLAGGGIVLSIRGGTDPAPAVFVFQGREEALTRQFFAAAQDVIADELARQDAPEGLHRGTYRDCETVRIGKDFHAARAGAAVVVSNNVEELRRTLDLFRDGDTKSMARSAGLATGRKQVPADALAWAWLNLETTAHKNLGDPNTPNPLVLFGGWIDVLRRAPYLTFHVGSDGDGYGLSVVMPKGRAGMRPELALHVPPAGLPGSRPLLEPKGVAFSSSYYLDLAKFWEHRASLLDDEGRKGLEKAEKDLGKFLAGAPLSKVLNQLGAYQRFVVAHQETPPYQTVPGQRLPAFGMVLELREPEAFGKAMDTILRTVALALTTQVRLQLIEEKRGDWKLVGYRFDETRPLAVDTTNARFNFAPCFARVGNQFVVSSTLELGRELIDLVDREGKSPVTSHPEPARARAYAEGGAALLAAGQDQLMVQTILNQAVSPDEARKQVRELIDMVRGLGAVRMQTSYGQQEFRFDLSYSSR